MNYNSLMNKPTINYRELIGDNSVSEVGGITEEQFNTLLNTDLSSYYTKAQIDELFARSYVFRDKSGGIVTFECPASVNGIDKVVSEIVAVQDLHGYDYPWAGGAGKNKLQVTATSQTINGVTFTVNDDGTIKVNGTATADARFVIGEYILKAGSSVRLNGSPVDGSTSTIALGYQGFGIVSTANSDRVCDRTSASTDWDNDVYISVTSGYTANNLTFKPMIRLDTVSDGTFAPYSNICPFSGWSAVNVYDTGYNIWDEEWEVGLIDHTTGNNTTGNGIYSKNYISIKANTNYYAHISTWYRIAFYDDNNIYISGEQSSSNIFTTPTNAKYMKFSTNALYGTTYNNDISINYPSTDTEYHAYNGQTYTTVLKDGQGNPMTCYGGTLSNENGVQSLTLTHGYIASYNGETLPSTWESDRDVYAPGTTPTIGAEVVYKLETQQQITQDSLSIVSTGGINNIWCDSGDITVRALDKIIQG